MKKAFDEIEIRAELTQMRVTLPLLVEHAQIQAALTRAKFNAFVKEGFTEEQAIRLCMEIKA